MDNQPHNKIGDRVGNRIESIGPASESRPTPNCLRVKSLSALTNQTYGHKPNTLRNQTEREEIGRFQGGEGKGQGKSHAWVKPSK